MGMIDHLEASYESMLSVYKKNRSIDLSNEKTITKISMETKVLRFLAAAEIRLKNDHRSFRVRINRAVDLKKLMLEGYDRGMPISNSYVTMTSFHWGLDALAAGNYRLAKEFFGIIGGRPKAERRNDSKFISSIGYATKELVLQGSCSKAQLAMLKAQFSMRSYIGYAMLIEGISKRDVDLAANGVQEILKGHKTLIRPGGFFSLTPDEIVCFWALGLVNYAAFEGMKIRVPESPLLPKILLKNK